ncbi:MAG: NAD(P)H-quinone oxidoreductase, partial [Microthrixaceae bacterium]|nr:NAD(P)H-quinone oxidoreductase [Microthrixaceae bacterium]
LNRADLLQRRGLYPGPPMDHEIPGMEYSGTVAEVGERVSRWSVGDRVMGIVGGGAYAEAIAVDERQTMAVPDAVELDEAAAIPEAFLTAFDALVVQGGLTSGRWAFVHAGASGVGTAAIQIAKAIGARVIVTASSNKLDACARLGADVVIDYRNEDVVGRTKEAVGRTGVHTVLDVVGAGTLADNLKVAATGARIVQVGTMGGGTGEINLGALMMKRVALIGTVLRSRPSEEKAALTQRVATELLPLFDSGALRPVIDTTFALDDIAAAHEHMEANANVGKVLISVGGGS